MDTLQIEFGNMVRKYRKEKGYSTQKLAELLGVSVGLVNNIENGKSDVFKLEVLSQLFKILQIPSKDTLEILFYEQILDDLGYISNSQKDLFKNLPYDYQVIITRNFNEILKSYTLIFEKYKHNNDFINFINTFITQYSCFISSLLSYILNNFDIEKKYHEI